MAHPQLDRCIVCGHPLSPLRAGPLCHACELAEIAELAQMAALPRHERAPAAGVFYALGMLLHARICEREE